MSFLHLGTLLMGFGVGKWAPTSDQPSGIRYDIKHVLTYLTVKADDGSKKTAQVCEHLEELMTTGKDGRLSYYDLSPNVPVVILIVRFHKRGARTLCVPSFMTDLPYPKQVLV